MPAARRADALRNRAAVVAAAADVFAARGVGVPLADVAAAAGVGIATLHRNFPTRDALVVAVYLQDIDDLCDGVAELLARHPAAEAVAVWMRRFVAAVAGRAGMCQAVRAVVTGVDPDLCRVAHERIDAALGTLVAVAVAEGSVRADADVGDLVVAMSGFCLIADALGSADSVSRSVGVLVDGLRPR
ncbi:SbtR family transcriptional regulator [Pseudonocardia abyssalis]|uniref:TetR family transcriptional regulator n=1 Tax=Pseudonocardia abyssalis TaxID=2792008 RepID=A0ABS6URJ6_9PSEU|nr:TetR family transcriptional regulator [Pseudonocardia abyssalis]MBW0114300.1 TetR family transcriptional regulator [Pseudonocardia abyssalis]MBW0134862.1 TetR family transcriptional regulator [Pseudonocardia abyssalis]